MILCRVLPAQDRDVLVPVLEMLPLEGVGEHHLEGRRRRRRGRRGGG